MMRIWPLKFSARGPCKQGVISILRRPCQGNPRDAKMRQCLVRKKRRGTGLLRSKNKGNRDRWDKKEEESCLDSNRSCGDVGDWLVVIQPASYGINCFVSSGPRGLSSLVDDRVKLDKTVWAEELLAQKHERIFIHLWDNLRAASAKHKVLARFPFNRLIIGKAGSTEIIGAGSLPHALFRIRRHCSLMKNFKGPSMNLRVRVFASCSQNGTTACFRRISREEPGQPSLLFYTSTILIKTDYSPSRPT